MQENKIIHNMLKPFHVEQSGDNFFLHKQAGLLFDAT